MTEIPFGHGGARAYSTCRRAIAWLVLLVGLLLVGCAGDISDDISLDEVASQAEGIVIASVELPSGFYNCGSATLWLSRRGPNGNAKRDSANVANSAVTFRPSQFRLPAGKYTLRNLECVEYRGRIRLLKKAASLGTFEVKAGEVVNVGRISFGGFYTIATTPQVAPLLAEQLTWLRKNKPKLLSRMTTRHFQPNAGVILRRRP
ncbi:MAG: hypothetical protein AAGF81_18605 [Pseudomonadota bacterium]